MTPSSRVDFTCSMGLLLMVSGGMSNGDLLKHMRSSFVLSQLSAILLFAVHCATSVAGVCSELLWPQGEHFSHMVQSSTYFTCPQDVC